MADGFVLNVDAKFLQDLEKADKKMSDLVDKSNALSKSVVESFNKISTQGVDPFLEKLKQQKNALEAIASIDVSKASSKGLKDLVKSTSDAVDQINKIINALQGSGTSMDVKNATKKVESEIKKETDVYLKELDKQIKARQEYLTRQENVEKERVRITQDASKQVEKEIQKENDAYLKSLEIKIKAAQEQQLRNEQIRSQRESISNKAKEQVEREIKYENDAYLRGLSERIKQEQEYQLRNEKVKEERKRIEAEVTKFVEKEIQKEKDAHLKSLSEQIKARQEYLSRMQRIQEAQAKRESQMRANQYKYIQKIGDTSGQANAAYNRLYSSQGVKSINNMNNVLQKLRDAQNKLNLATDSGKKKYEELGKKIQNIEKDLKKLSDSQDKFSKGQSRLMNTSDQLQRKLALVFSVSAIQGYVNKLIEVRKEFELQQKSLQVLLKDKDEADKLWQQTLDLAIKSPFRVKELVNYTKQLAAYRIETSKLHQTTKMLSDVSAGLGVDMQRIILAFGQVRAAQFLRGTELRQFTEAGIPMLDELANLFTELEGRAVSTGEVFERISKRMVLFKDVEQVFKRMTSASGIFYKMQEEQSKTLAGMISNLHDSMDIMLNDIGKANEKEIKGLIQATRTLIDNWRMVGVVIKEVGAALLLFNLSKFATGWRMAAGAMAMSDITMKGIAGTAGKLRVALSTLIATISANPFTAILAALGAAGYAIWEYAESIDAVNKKYDEMSIREVNVIDKLEALNEKSKEYNTIIKNNKKDSEERNNAEKENLKILKEIKTKYPELVNLVSKQTDGTIDLTKAIEAQNEKLIENIALQQKAKGGWFYDSLDENYKDAIEEFTELQSEINSIKVISAEAMSKLSQADISTEDYKKFSSLLAEIRKSKDFDSLKVAYYNFTQEVVRNGKEVTKQVPLLGMFAKQWLNVANAAGSYKQSIKDLKQSFERQKDDIFVGITDAYNKVFSENAHEPYDEANEAGAKAAGAWIEGFLDDFGIIDENIREWAKIEIPKFVKVDVIYAEKEDTPQELEPWAKRVKDAITKVNNEIKKTNPNATQFDLFPLPDPGQTREQYLNIAKSVLDIAKATYAEGQQIEDEATVNRTKMLSGYADDVEKILNIIKKETTKGSGKDWMSEVIKGVKEAHQEYLKLSKTLDSVEAKQMALDKYEGVFNEAVKNANLGDIKLGDLTFETEEGAKDALRTLKDLLPENAKNARLKIEEALAGIEGEVRIKTKVEQDKQILDSIEEMFGGYEISLELQKLNIPPDLAKQLFNIDALTLPELKSKVVSMESKFVGTDMEEEYRKFLKKIDEMEDKQNIERLEKFVKFLAKTSDEIANVQKQGALDITYAQNLFLGGKIDAEKYSEIIKNVVNEVNKDISKINLEKFKESPEYIAAMGDMAGYTISELSKLSDKIRDLISENAKSMTPDEIKAYNDALNKINEQVNKIKSPFGKSWLSELREINALEKELTKEKEKQLRLQQELQNKQASLVALNKKLAELQARPQSAGRDIQIQGVLNDITQVQKGMSNINGQLNTTAGNISSIGGKLEKVLGGMGSSVATVDKVVKGISQSIDATITVFNDFKDLMDSFGVDTDTAAWQDITLAMETLGEVNQKATQGWEDLKNGNVAGAVANTLGVVMSVIKGINKIHDAKYERRIQREIKLVEDLERAYKKLEKQIDKAYEFDTLKGSYDAAQKNIDAQIESYNKMIAAEEDKKKTDKDKIKEWQIVVEDLKEQQRELLETQVEELGGSYDFSSITEEFVNAWLDAFKDTGNGLKGLEENFEDFWTNIALKQAVMGGASKIMQPLLDAVNKALEDDFKLDESEMSNIDQLSQKAKEEMNLFLQQWYDRWGDFIDKDQGDLSGLQRGIQELTESTGQEIAAYLNSIRFFVAEQTTYLSQIASSFGNTEVENPMVEQLRIIAAQTSAINSLLQGLVRGGHSLGGSGLKVFIS